MAVGDSNLRERIAGIACLATPFIVASERSIGRDTWAIVKVSSIVLLSFVILVLVIKEWSVFWDLVAMAIAFFLLSIFSLLGKRVQEHASKLRRELTPRPLDKHQVLLLRSPADEASASLAVFQFVSQLTVRLFHFGESLHVKVKDLGKSPRNLLWIAASAGTVTFGTAPLFAVLSRVVLGVDLKDLIARWFLIGWIGVTSITLGIFIAALLTLIPAVARMIFPRRFRRPSSSNLSRSLVKS
jgi:Ca2+/Na+ antiporter